jgi:hypothetical protein
MVDLPVSTVIVISGKPVPVSMDNIYTCQYPTFWSLYNVSSLTFLYYSVNAHFDMFAIKYK